VWTSHRPVAEIPESPMLRKRSVTDEDLAGSTANGSPSPSSGLNETMTLITKLDRQCDLGAGGAEEDKQTTNLNSTFAVDEEPMDVDSTRSLSDLSRIQPPSQGNVRIAVSPRSPVRAGFGISPRGGIPRRTTPSPLRQSTMLDLKSGSLRSIVPPPVPAIHRKSPGLKPPNPQTQGNKGLKKKMVSSASTSVLPRPGVSGPLSFRSAIQKLNGKESDGGTSYMQGTQASKLKTDRKPGTKGLENPVVKRGGLKRTTSTVLKHSNK
jgi:hypothetical protein